MSRHWHFYCFSSALIFMFAIIRKSNFKFQHIIKSPKSDVLCRGWPTQRRVSIRCKLWQSTPANVMMDFFLSSVFCAPLLETSYVIKYSLNWSSVQSNSWARHNTRHQHSEAPHNTRHQHSEAPHNTWPCSTAQSNAVIVAILCTRGRASKVPLLTIFEGVAFFALLLAVGFELSTLRSLPNLLWGLRIRKNLQHKHADHFS